MALERTMPNGLMVSVPASAVDGEGGEASSDLYFNPDDTYYFGSVGGVVSGAAGRPREIAVSRRIVSDFAHGIGTSPTENNGIVFRNSSAGAGGAAQYSPSIFLAGRDEANAELIFRNEVQPGASAGSLVWSASTGGAYSAAMRLSSAGALSGLDSVAATNAITSTSSYVDGKSTRIQGNTDFSTGLGSTCAVYAAQDEPLILRHHLRTDGANNVVFASVYDRNAASITNASTMRIHSFGWTNNADTYTELASIRGDGDITCVELRAGSSQATNSAACFNAASTLYIDAAYDRDAGLGTATNLFKTASDTEFALINRARGDSADNRVFTVVYDRNAASITNAATMRLMSWGWTNNTDTYTELASIRGDGAFHCGTVTASTTMSCTILTAGTRVETPNASSLIMRQANLSTGLGTTAGLDYAQDNPIAFVQNNASRDAASAVCIASVFDRNAASITNASTMRIHSFGWTNNADAYTELASIRGDGDFVCTKNIEAGITVSAAYSFDGPQMRLTANTLARANGYRYLHHVNDEVGSDAEFHFTHFNRTDGASNNVYKVSYDRNAASITNATTMRIMTWGWINNSDTYTELFAILADGRPKLTATAAADSTTPTMINLPTGGTAAQAGWVQVDIGGTMSWMAYWQ